MEGNIMYQGYSNGILLPLEVVLIFWRKFFDSWLPLIWYFDIMIIVPHLLIITYPPKQSDLSEPSFVILKSTFTESVDRITTSSLVLTEYRIVYRTRVLYD